jgi:CRISPR/Cas system endoribonuclease Cas6 (RAMP superfamily)
MALLKRQFITDTTGYPIAVILPLEDYKLVAPILEQERLDQDEADKLKLMEQAPNDARFMTDLQEVMSDFAEVDAQWWEALK